MRQAGLTAFLYAQMIGEKFSLKQMKTFLAFLALFCLCSPPALQASETLQVSTASISVTTYRAGNALLSYSADTGLSSHRYFLDDQSKSPWNAFLVAFLPGLIIRGLGHHYADQHVVGFGLLGAEILGVKLIDDGMGDWFGPKEGNRTKLDIGLVLFFGSWVFDFVRAPILVENANRRKQDSKLSGIFLNIEPTATGFELNLVKSF